MTDVRFARTLQSNPFEASYISGLKFGDILESTSSPILLLSDISNRNGGGSLNRTSERNFGQSWGEFLSSAGMVFRLR
jgi:hypothetical protein